MSREMRDEAERLTLIGAQGFEQTVAQREAAIGRVDARRLRRHQPVAEKDHAAASAGLRARKLASSV